MRWCPIQGASPLSLPFWVSPRRPVVLEHRPGVPGQPPPSWSPGSAPGVLGHPRRRNRAPAESGASCSADGQAESGVWLRGWAPRCSTCNTRRVACILHPEDGSLALDVSPGWLSPVIGRRTLWGHCSPPTGVLGCCPSAQHPMLLPLVCPCSPWSPWSPSLARSWGESGCAASFLCCGLSLQCVCRFCCSFRSFWVPGPPCPPSPSRYFQ